MGLKYLYLCTLYIAFSGCPCLNPVRYFCSTYMTSINFNKNNMILQQTDTLRYLGLFFVIAYKNAEDTKKDNQNSY